MTKDKYERGKAMLLGFLDSLFGSPLSEEEFIFHHKVLGEQEGWLMEDGLLTQDEILSIEEGWTCPAPTL